MQLQLCVSLVSGRRLFPVATSHLSLRRPSETHCSSTPLSYPQGGVYMYYFVQVHMRMCARE